MQPSPKQLNKTIIEYIPIFLKYCEMEKNHTTTTIKNYQHFLNRFIAWLKLKNLSDLKPEGLSPAHIQEYKLYLSRKSLKKATQSYYLIALRVLLSYFAEKDITSLPANKINLPRYDKFFRSVESLNFNQLRKLLNSLNINTLQGLRDRVLLEILIHTGLKINQLVALNKNDIEIRPEKLGIKIFDKKRIHFRILSLPKNATYWVKKYIKKRTDQNPALFINLKRSSTRLTIRSIQRIIKKHIANNDFSPSLTSETLRDTYISYLFNQDIKIINPSIHKVIITEFYDAELPEIYYNNSDTKKNFAISNWHIVENILNNEIAWLKEKILTMRPIGRNGRLSKNCDDCLFRKLAILIVSNRVKATEFKTRDKKTLWGNITKQIKRLGMSGHGKEWHRKMMDKILEHFRSRGYKVILEPTLNYGRSDLGVYPDTQNAIYIEVGTVSLFKLWYNLSTMKNTTFLLAPTNEYLIEFKT